jgi:hypothetical protein
MLFGLGRDIGGAIAAEAPIRRSPASKEYRRSAAASAFVRPTHQLEGRFDVPPGFGLLAVALLFERRGLLSGLGNGPVAVRFQQLPRVVVNVDFLHSHGVMLLSFIATGHADCAPRTVDVDTYQDLQGAS